MHASAYAGTEKIHHADEVALKLIRVIPKSHLKRSSRGDWGNAGRRNGLQNLINDGSA
jgi:hypothetical protein